MPSNGGGYCGELRNEVTGAWTRQPLHLHGRARSAIDRGGRPRDRGLPCRYGRRVVDASVIPDLPLGYTNAAAMMIGDMAAALIRADAAGADGLSFS